MEVARVLDAELDLFTVRKTGVPGREELAMGAVASGGIRWQNREVMDHLALAADVFEEVAAREEQELARREALYRGGAAFPAVKGRTVILVDDGLATGSTMRAAVMALRQMNPAGIVVAVPVGADGACEMLKPLVDELVCLTTPDTFVGVGSWYLDFLQLDDDDMAGLLEELGAEGRGPRGTARGETPLAPATTAPQGITVKAGGLSLPGLLFSGSPEGPLVLFIHGSGSSRLSGRNQQVAAALAAAGLRAVLFDLLTEREADQDEFTHGVRFDIAMLSGRVEGVLRWAERIFGDRPVGLFGASTGAAVALTLAARQPHRVGAVVSRGGRVDLSVESLRAVQCPVLMLVGGNDPRVLDLNEQAREQLGPTAALRVIPRAGHLFEEPGAIEEVSAAAAEWFLHHLRR